MAFPNFHVKRFVKVELPFLSKNVNLRKLIGKLKTLLSGLCTATI